MYNVSEIQHLDLPFDGIRGSLKGKFYYRIVEDGSEKSDYLNCYITDSSDSDSLRLYLSNDIGEAIINRDETFGMMVGGGFAYYDLDVEINCVIKKTTHGLICEDVKSLKLQKDGECQEFSFKVGI